MIVPDQERQIKIENKFKEILKANNVKENTRTFYKYQIIYFNGVIEALECDPPAIWAICLMSGRNILEERERKLKAK